MAVVLSLAVPYSGGQQIHDLLMTVGLEKAVASKRENFSANKISEKLCENYNCLNSDYSEIKQVTPGRMWHALASDLFLGNLDKKYWGWADSQSIHFLNFWRDFEPQIKFLLIYTSPQEYLAEYFIYHKHEASSDAIVSALSSWKNYNSELLRFYLENGDRCLLVNKEAALGRASEFTNQMNKKLECKLSLNSTANLTPRSRLSCEKQLILNLIQENLEVLNFYEELESCADLPMYEDLSNDKKIYHTLNELREEREVHDKLEETVESLREKNLSLELKVGKSLKEYMQEPAKAEELELKKENELLLLQLHQVQEELEVYFNKYQELCSNSDISVEGSAKRDETIIDLRHFIEGQNWYHAEHDGRWAGPDHVSSLKIPHLPQGKYEIELNIVGAMSPKIIRQMRLLWDGAELPKKVTQPWAGVKAILRRYYLLLFQNREGGPLVLKSKFEIGPDNINADQFLGIQLPCTISPSSRGQQDTRDLGIKLSEVKVIPI